MQRLRLASASGLAASELRLTFVSYRPLCWDLRLASVFGALEIQSCARQQVGWLGGRYGWERGGGEQFMRITESALAMGGGGTFGKRPVALLWLISGGFVVAPQQRWHKLPSIAGIWVVFFSR